MDVINILLVCKDIFYVQQEIGLYGYIKTGDLVILNNITLHRTRYCWFARSFGSRLFFFNPFVSVFDRQISISPNFPFLTISGEISFFCFAAFRDE